MCVYRKRYRLPSIMDARKKKKKKEAEKEMKKRKGTLYLVAWEAEKERKLWIIASAQLVTRTDSTYTYTFLTTRL